ncbi:hypothetical protein GOBAR_AA09627 [Gossypium barbadense]|uniref:Uncharacterized protein n=1 Tax=Gossypium barbadense TaxID=3634 RepID=A0A2P5Y613_GOSBA|nr:hypothetical protein GOBAR_AA09627 [Gossypium barbadense]
MRQVFDVTGSYKFVRARFPDSDQYTLGSLALGSSKKGGGEALFRVEAHTVSGHADIGEEGGESVPGNHNAIECERLLRSSFSWWHTVNFRLY